ncbi:MAG: phasin family protein [Gammaproteobacteria bacterium]
MSNDIFTTMTGSSSLAYESMQELGAINSKTISRLAEIQLDFARLGLESSMEQAKLLTDAGSYENLMAAESDLASRYGDRIMALARETTEVMTESRDEFVEWLEKRFEEGGKQAVKPSKPKPATKKSGNAAKPAPSQAA